MAPPSPNDVGGGGLELVWPVWRVERRAETASTNVDALTAARAGAAAGLVFVADHQTAGRGRLGRAWVDEPGDCLLVSLLLRPGVDPSELHRFTQAVAIAGADACSAVGGFRPDIKWPNDLLVGERKLAGILAESIVEDRAVKALVVGMGLNVRAAPPGAVCATEAAGRRVDRFALLTALLSSLRALTAESVATRYRTELATIGQRVRVEQPPDVFEGVACGVSPQGHLLVDVGERRVEVSAGDVVHLRRVT